MSILPSETQGFESSPSSEPLSPNPNPNHGNHLSPQPPSPLSESPPSPSGQLPGPVAPAAERSRGSSKKVSQYGTPNGKKFGSYQPRGMSGAAAASRSQRGHGSIDSHGSPTQSTGRKAQVMSGNHLLNFQYDPISRPQHRQPPPPRRPYKIKPYNKDLFLQANYKFVVLDSGNYAPESMDPDKMLKWEDIICVRYSTPSQVQCPICLEYPLCPQITSCGHIFCFPCILQYLLIGEDCHKVECFKRCPLCFIMISRKDLYTLYLENVKEFSVGDSVEFMLLTRQKDSFAPIQKIKQGSGSVPQNSDQISNLFSKFTFTSDVDLSVRRAMTDLDGWLARAESGLVDDLEKLPYVSAAMEELEKRRKFWNEHRVLDANRSFKYADYQSESKASSTAGNFGNVEDDMCGLQIGVLPTDSSDQKIFLLESGKHKSQSVPSLDQTSDVGQILECKEPNLLPSDENKFLERRLTGSTEMKESESYNFYQVVDGQNIILHPLNIKCLLQHYGSYEMLPHRISGKILQLETITQSESTRRRFRYLSHLSLTTTFQLCEIDLRGILPDSALLPFMDEIKKREKQRKQLAKKERREKIEAEAMNQISMSIQYDIGQSSHVGSSTYSLDDFQALEGASVMSTSPPIVGERKTFSNVTKLGFAAGHDSPALKNGEENSPFKSNLKIDSSGTNGSRSVNTPSFANMISRAKTGGGLEGTKTNEAGKKGKKSTQVLLSTSGGRRY